MHQNVWECLNNTPKRLGVS